MTISKLDGQGSADINNYAVNPTHPLDEETDLINLNVLIFYYFILCKNANMISTLIFVQIIKP